MELNSSFSEPPEEAPKFFDLNEQIKRIASDIDSFAIDLTSYNADYRSKYDVIQVKIDRLEELLGRYKLEQENLYSKKVHQEQDRRIKLAKDRTELQALERQQEQEKQNKDLEEIMVVVKEITKDFAAWFQAREYQVEDVVQIVQQYMQGSSGVMNANEMALGKTFETLVAMFIIFELFRREHHREPTALWLSKKSIIETGGTFNEAKRWFPELKVFSIKGASNKHAIDLVFQMASKGGFMVLTNYEMVKKMPKKDWDFLILDEVHKLKGGANAGGPTAIWEAVKSLTVGFQMMLTGTPLVNRMEEIWSYLHLFDPKAFPDAKKFTQSFRAYRDLSGEMKFDIRSENLLKQVLRGRLIRRRATEVGLQMPPVNEIVRWLQHNEKQGLIYQQMRDKFFIWLEGQSKPLSAMSILAQLIRLRQINVLPVANFKNYTEDGWDGTYTKLDERDSSKLDEAMDIIEQTDDQVLVFSTFNEPLKELAFRLQVEGKRVAIISSEYAGKMGDFEEGFQRGDIDVLLINMAMGEGMNLHKDSAKWKGGARAVILLDKWYNPARNEQAIARAVRPGESEGQPVFVYDLKVEHSIDLWLQALNDEKSAQFNLVTESSALRTSSEWRQLLKDLL